MTEKRTVRSSLLALVELLPLVPLVLLVLGPSAYCRAAPRSANDGADLQRKDAADPPVRKSTKPEQKTSGITYRGSTGKELGMALGGLGTSTLEIGRDGAFQNIRLQNDWTSAINPTPTGAFLSVYARTESGNSAGRLLQLETPEGLDGVEGLTYTGRFPFVELTYQDKALPCEVSMEAFSPFVPHDAASSSLPLVFFTLRFRNPGPEAVTAAAALSWVNDIAVTRQRSRGWPTAGNKNTLLGVEHPAVLLETRMKELAGSECLLACLPAEGVRYSAVSDWWRRAPGRWMGPNVTAKGPNPLTNWRRFLDSGKLPDESDDDDGLGRFSYHQPVAAVAGEVQLAAGEEKEVRFALVWFFPYHWDLPGGKAKILLGHQYVARFPKGSRDIADWAFARRDSLRRRSLAWRSLIEESSLPPQCRALMTEVLYLLPRLSWWLEDGTFVLHESINCPRIQATVLGVYAAPVLAAMFPELHAKSLRAIAAAQLDNGEIPSTLGFSSVRHCEYRLFNPGDASVFPIVTTWETLWGGDPEFSGDMYPVIQKVLRWGERELDVDRDGVPDTHGIDQGWDTFPMYGAAAYIADQWIAALLAGEKMARRFGDSEFEQWCRGVRRRASETAEKVLWNGDYYDLAHDLVGGGKSDICFADQFTYGTVAANILGLGDVHPRDRVRRSLQSIWRVNVQPSKFVCRMGSTADGAPADSSIHKEQKGAASQSNAFTPVSTAPLAAAAIQYGMMDEGLALVEETADVIINHVKEPWSGKLLFDSRNGNWFYGTHYSDCLILWDVMPALLGVEIDAFERSLKFAPPRIPVKIPVFGRLYCGQVEFSQDAGAVQLRLTNFTDKPTMLRTLTIDPPEGTTWGACRLQQGAASRIEAGKASETILTNVIIPPNGELVLRWK